MGVEEEAASRPPGGDVQSLLRPWKGLFGGTILSMPHHRQLSNAGVGLLDTQPCPERPVTWQFLPQSRFQPEDKKMHTYLNRSAPFAFPNY